MTQTDKVNKHFRSFFHYLIVFLFFILYAEQMYVKIAHCLYIYIKIKSNHYYHMMREIIEILVIICYGMFKQKNKQKYVFISVVIANLLLLKLSKCIYKI